MTKTHPQKQQTPDGEDLVLVDHDDSGEPIFVERALMESDKLPTHAELDRASQCDQQRLEEN